MIQLEDNELSIVINALDDGNGRDRRIAATLLEIKKRQSEHVKIKDINEIQIKAIKEQAIKEYLSDQKLKAQK